MSNRNHRFSCGRGTQSRNHFSGSGEPGDHFRPSTLSSRTPRNPLNTQAAVTRYPSKPLALTTA